MRSDCVLQNAPAIRCFQRVPVALQLAKNETNLRFALCNVGYSAPVRQGYLTSTEITASLEMSVRLVSCL